MPFSSRNLLVGEILPRAMPVRSLIRHSTSVILRSFSQLESWSNLVLIETSGLVRADLYIVGSALPRRLPASLTKGLEDGEIIRVGSYLPFRVPLHPQCEAFGTFDGEGFDQPVRRQCFYAKARRQTLNALAMNGIALNLLRQADAGEQPARLHMQRVTQAILLFYGQVTGLAVIHQPCNLVYTLMQRAPESHIHLLKATANAEHRDTGGNCCFNQGKSCTVTRRVMGGAGFAGIASIVVWFNVGWRAGKHQAIEVLQQVSLIKLLAQCGNDHWHTANHQIGRAHV